MFMARMIFIIYPLFILGVVVIGLVQNPSAMAPQRTGGHEPNIHAAVQISSHGIPVHAF